MSVAAGRSWRWVSWVLVGVVMATIFVLSSQSGLRVSEDTAVDKPFRISGHLLAFSALAAFLLVALSWGRRPRLRDVILALLLTVAYGLSDEWHQSFVPERMGALDDLAIDVVGALVGLAVAWIVLTFAAVRRSRAGVTPPAP